VTISQHWGVAIVVEQDVISTPADEHGLIRREQYAYKGFQGLRPLVGYAKR
jgi:hypothetical protein